LAQYRQAGQDRHNRQQFEAALRASDVFLVGHPKSGNTWLAYMLAMLVNRDTEASINISNVGNYIPTIHDVDERIASFSQLPDPRIFRNEGPKYPELYPRTIYILRDPRSVLLSYYHHCVHDTGRNGWAIGDFVDEMLSEGCIRSLEPFLVRWDTQVMAWQERAKTQPVLMVKYEDLMSDCYAQLERLSGFIGLEVDENLLTMVIERGGFSNMRKDEEKFGAESFPGEKGKKGFFVRSGKVDSWKTEMPAEVIEKIEKSFRPVMTTMGYLDGA
jgi:hypothetical protein